MVLDGEKNEALRVLLQKRLVCLLGSDGRGDRSLLDFICFYFFEVRNADDGLVTILFFTGESDILSVSIADAACMHISKDASSKCCSSYAYLLGRCRLQGRHCEEKR
jgi:hypothetical protein